VNITCDMPYLGSGNVAPTITVKTAVAASARVPGLITNTAWLSNALSDSAPADNIAKASTIISTWVDLELTKISLVNPVAAGSFLTYELGVKNNGWVTATTQVVTDTLPVSATYVSFSGAGWSMTSGFLTNKIFTRNVALPAGSSAPTITIVMQAPPPGGIPACSCLINTASAGTTIGDPFPANNTDISNTTSISLDADLVMFKSASQSVVNGGNTYSYTLHVTNNGPSVAASVVVTDAIPSGPTGLTIVSPAPAGSNWNCPAPVGNLVTCTYTTVLAVGGVTPNIIITVQSPVADTTLVNTANVSSTQSDPQPGNNSASATTTSNNCHHDQVNASRSSISASPTDVPADNASTSRITVTLRDACDAVLTAPTSIQVTLNNAGSDTVTTVGPNPTTNGVIAFDLKSNTPGTRTYTALAHDTFNVQPDVTVSSTTINWYSCPGVVALVVGGGQKWLQFDVQNLTGITRKLTALSLTWPLPSGGFIKNLSLQATNLWSAPPNITTSPFVIPGGENWIGGTDAVRTLANGAAGQTLQYDFNFSVPGTGNYSLTSTWTDDTGGRVCTVVSAATP
jgi:uncharacterized repeat protein (TIGR01451 family)